MSPEQSIESCLNFAFSLITQQESEKNYICIGARSIESVQREKPCENSKNY